MFRVFKKKPDRKVFGFLCDRGLSERVKELSAFLEVPIYCLCEHLMQLGLAHLGLQMRDGQENIEQVKKEMQSHLTDCHLLVKRLPVDQYEKDIIAGHAEIGPEQKQMVDDCIKLAFKLSESGVSYELVNAWMGNMAKRYVK